MTIFAEKIIDHIRFGLLSPEEIRKMSATRIITADTYDEDGLPIPSGLMDGTLGTIEPGQRCQTCGNRVGECPGHFGHIELARPVVHVGFARKLLKVLRAVCRNCSRVLLTEEQIESFKKKQRKYQDVFKTTNDELIDLALKTARRTKVCPYCEEKRKKITIEKPTTFYEEEEGQSSRRLTPMEIRDRLERISDEDCIIMGINPEVARPEYMILTVLLIPPVCVRPSITLDSGIRSEDDLTHKLVDVIRINQRLKENIDAGAPQLIVEDLWELLQYHVTTFFNNEVSGIPPARHRSGRALRTLSQRLKGKEGRFRSNLSGKRVDFSARTVISPNPHISINEVGVPKRIAKILTVPQRVTEWNIEQMKQLVINGPYRHPGANYIIRSDNRRIDLRFVKNLELVAENIVPGFVIERHLHDGDLVLFNRQPSLHRMSIMAHEIRVMPGKTFRLALTVCPPYNADFDGDEMNLHVPQGDEARAEANYLLKVQEHILSPRFGGPIIGGIQDYISMAYMLTRKDAYFTRDQMFQLLYAGNLFKRQPEFDIDSIKPRITDPEPLYWGKDIFSAQIPPGINLSTKSKFCRNCKDGCKGEQCEFDAYVVIRNGQLLSGVIDKKTIGAMQSNSILHRVVKEYGNQRGREFLDDIGNMLLLLINFNGLTMGLDEVAIPQTALDNLTEIIDQAEKKSEELIEAYYDNNEDVLEPAPGRTLQETLELRLNNELAKVRNQAGEIAADSLGDKTHSVIMTKSGARGNPLNLAQMAACVGQQAVRGNRIHRGYLKRTLPHFKNDDLSPRARGFVVSSYRRGLNPIEFFFHAMGGREGLVDTAVRTSTSGYMQRRLVNALQDMVAQNDGTVRTNAGTIVQFKYGDDGIDPAKSDHGTAINLDIILLKAKALPTDDEDAKPAKKKKAAKKKATKKKAAKKKKKKATKKKAAKKKKKATKKKAAKKK
ncbi:MAG: DNA-directed RNA polymerase subunit A' [Promethearchaeota archaeon]